MLVFKFVHNTGQKYTKFSFLRQKNEKNMFFFFIPYY